MFFVSKYLFEISNNGTNYAIKSIFLFNNHPHGRIAVIRNNMASDCLVITIITVLSMSELFRFYSGLVNLRAVMALYKDVSW
jgi:hypothetical protein